MIILGIFLIVLSFFNIPLGFGNPPYSIGDFSIFLSGASLIFFGFLGYNTYTIPVILPAVAVIGFQLYDRLTNYLITFSQPLILPITSLTKIFLQILHADFTIEGNIISYFSVSGEQITLIITENCTGIWSLGTFTVTCLIILVSFPQARTFKSLVFILIGYLGTIVSNILRIWLIVFVGYYWGNYIAIKVAHDYFGWIIFSIWVILFWYLFITRHLKISVVTGKKEA